MKWVNHGCHDIIRNWTFPENVWYLERLQKHTAQKTQQSQHKNTHEILFIGQQASKNST